MPQPKIEKPAQHQEPKVELRQKSIEEYFTPYKEQLKDPDLKAKLLYQITDLVYERNQKLVDYEQEQDPVAKNGQLEELSDSEETIKNTIKEFFENLILQQ